MKLYEYNEQFANFMEVEGGAVDVETGEFFNQEALDALALERTEKLKNCMIAVKNMRAEAKAHKEEADAQAAIYKTLTNKADWLENYIARNLREKEKLDFAEASIKWTSSVSVVVENESLVPDEFCTIETVRKVAKNEIKKVLKAGQEVAGCSLDSHYVAKVK